MKRAILTLGVGTMMAAPVQAATLISNGDFEADPLFSGTLTGWNVTESSPDGVALVDGNFFVPCCGANGSAASLDNQFVAFGSGNSSIAGVTIDQNFSSTNGSFALNFDLGVIGSNNPQTITFEIYDVGLGALAFSGTTPGQGPDANFDTTFQTYTYNFQLNGSGNYNLAFSAGGETNGTDALLDNIGLVLAVPEPSTWALMLLGFGAIGASMRSTKARKQVRVRYS